VQPKSRKKCSIVRLVSFSFETKDVHHIQTKFFIELSSLIFYFRCTRLHYDKEQRMAYKSEIELKLYFPSLIKVIELSLLSCLISILKLCSSQRLLHLQPLYKSDYHTNNTTRVCSLFAFGLRYTSQTEINSFTLLTLNVVLLGGATMMHSWI
jgi:hypothetical protein